ncbi:MAG: hypothetical protein AAGG02_05065 [Cyanobacteria bacterium P01_H01_bin.15]
MIDGLSKELDGTYSEADSVINEEYGIGVNTDSDAGVQESLISDNEALCLLLSGEGSAYDSFISAKLGLKFYGDGVEVVPDGDKTVELTFLLDGIEIGSQTLSGTDFELQASHRIYHAEIFLDI